MSRFANLKDLVCLVAGGAGGLGRATVERLVQQGAKAVICDINKSAGEEIAHKLGDSCTFVPADVTNEGEVTKAIKTCSDKFGRLDVALNCAASIIAAKAYNSNKDRVFDLPDFIRVMNVNAVGTFNVVRLAVQQMAKNKPDADGHRGIVLMTSSTAAFDGQLGQAAYAASKGAISAMTLPIARDVAPLGIRVMTIAPGLIESAVVPSRVSPDIRRYLDDLPLTPKGYGKRESFVRCVEALITNSNLNGDTIRLDAGMREEFWYAQNSFQRQVAKKK